MNTRRLESTIASAQAEGLLPSVLQPLDTDTRPWPVVLLTALGAWLAAIPLLSLIALWLGDFSHKGFTSGVVGVVLMAGSVTVLRAKLLPVFAEQLAVPGLMAGVGLVAWTLADQLGNARVVAAVLCTLVLALSAALPQIWLRALLGAAAATLAGFALATPYGWDHGRDHGHTGLSSWWTLHVQLAVALALAAALLRRAPAGALARRAAWAEIVGSGWLLATLVGLAGWAGMSFLVGANLGPQAAQHLAGEVLDPNELWRQLGPNHAVSALLAASGGLWLASRWQALRQGWCGVVVLVLTALAAMMPSLGACLLVLALCVGTQRWRMGVAAAVAAVWIVGAFYYALNWPLATKGGVLLTAAAVLAGLAAWALRRQRTPAAASNAVARANANPSAAPARWGFALSLLLTLVVVNGSIWQKEHLIRHGQAVFVPLVPVDPRSLMQGDYMTLNFLPRSSETTPELNTTGQAFNFAHPRMVFKRDSQGILSVKGPDQGQTLADDEVAIELVPKNGGWILVTDAFHFKEGEAKRWAAARYGEFRVDAKGKALLVGLRGEALRPL